jgi:hypothetical protein
MSTNTYSYLNGQPEMPPGCHDCGAITEGGHTEDCSTRESEEELNSLLICPDCEGEGNYGHTDDCPYILRMQSLAFQMIDTEEDPYSDTNPCPRCGAISKWGHTKNCPIINGEEIPMIPTAVPEPEQDEALEPFGTVSEDDLILKGGPEEWVTDPVSNQGSRDDSWMNNLTDEEAQDLGLTAQELARGQEAPGFLAQSHPRNWLNDILRDDDERGPLNKIPEQVAADELPAVEDSSPYPLDPDRSRFVCLDRVHTRDRTVVLVCTRPYGHLDSLDENNLDYYHLDHQAECSWVTGARDVQNIGEPYSWREWWTLVRTQNRLALGLVSGVSMVMALLMDRLMGAIF